MKSEILKLLREADTYVSGQDLCNQFSVSRTAVWKVINQLKEEGYSIEAVRNKGYHMVKSPDVLNKEAIKSHVGSKEFGCQVVCFDVTDSTNIQAKILAEQGCAHGTLVVADQQLHGKGRRGRTWESPKGSGIFMSLVLRPTFVPNKAPMLTLVMAYSIAKVLRAEIGDAQSGKLVERDSREGQVVRNSGETQEAVIQIKWPNDIIVNGKKVCGILTEMNTEIDYINHVVIGVGINANTEDFPEELTEMATSLKLEQGAPVLRAKLIASILEEFEYQYGRFCEAGNLSYMMEAYNEILVNSGRQVRVLDPKEEYEAEALGIDEEGELLVKKQEGAVERVFAGEVSVRGIYGYV